MDHFGASPDLGSSEPQKEHRQSTKQKNKPWGSTKQGQEPHRSKSKYQNKQIPYSKPHKDREWLANGDVNFTLTEEEMKTNKWADWTNGDDLSPYLVKKTLRHLIEANISSKFHKGEEGGGN